MRNFHVMDSSAPCSKLENCAEDYARRKPTQAVATAFGAGFLLTVLPVGAIVACLVAIAMTLVRPALLFLGLVKACELCGANPNLAASTESTESEPHQ